MGFIETVNCLDIVFLSFTPALLTYELENIMKTDNSLYMKHLRLCLTTQLDMSLYAEDILDFIEAGLTPEESAKQLNSYVTGKSHIHVNYVDPKRTYGAPKSPHEAAAKLVRDYGKLRGCKQALQETWNYPKGSPSFMFWGQVAYLLND